MSILWNRSINDNIRWHKRIKYVPKNPGTEEYWALNITQIITNGVDCYPWREVYAWWPVRTVSGKRVWLRKIYKRKFWAVWGTGFHMEPQVEYGTVFDMLEYE